MRTKKFYFNRVVSNYSQTILKLIEEAELSKNINLVDEPEFTSGELTQLETKFDRRSNLIEYIQISNDGSGLNTGFKYD